ncbi:ABC transporter permease [Yoonia sp. R2331]|uniref:ABC transporter permease n=1 Tax=Yoonia sp. R2331 TaxID=3237238 RepID=UPI0034E5383C
MKRWLSSETGRGYLMISPPFVYAILLLAVPLALVLAMSVWTQDFLDIQRGFSMANYIEAWTNPLYQTLMLRSLKIALITTLVTVLIAYPIAYYISFVVPDRQKPIWIFLITIPFWTSYLMRIFLWKVILGFNGVVNGSLMELGLIAEPLDFILYNQAAVVITLSHAWVPFAVLPIFVTMERIDRSLLEAARDLGDSPFWRLIRVTLPLSMPGVVAATLIVFVPTIGDYITPRLVGGPDGLMIANMIEVQFKKSNNAPLGAALAVSSMMLVTAVALIFVWLNRRHMTRRG